MKNKRGLVGGEWYPMFLSLMIIIFFGVIFPLIVSPFMSSQDVTLSSLVTPFISIVEDGIDLGLIEFNPFSWFGSSLQTFLLDSLYNFAVMPNWYIASIMIITVFGILYTIARLIRG